MSDGNASKRTVDFIIESFQTLGGRAHLNEIRTVASALAKREIGDAQIRGRLEEYSSDSSVFQQKKAKGHKVEDLFRSVYGVDARKGVWELRNFKYDAEKQKEYEEDLTDDGSPEGRAKLAIHLIRERSRSLIRKFKKSLVDPRCRVCDFRFDELYGDLGVGFIEAHHTLPVSLLDGRSKTNISDLIAVCANCHRMLHKRGLTEWKELRRVVQVERQKER